MRRSIRDAQRRDIRVLQQLSLGASWNWLMFGFAKKKKIRRERARQFKAETTESPVRALVKRIGVWPAVVTLVFFLGAIIISLTGDPGIPYALNQRIDQPILARVSFGINDQELEVRNRESARQAVPNYYRVNTDFIDRIVGETELSALFEDAQVPTFEEFKAKAANHSWKAHESVYQLLNGANETTRSSFSQSLEQLREGLRKEATALPSDQLPRDPPSTAADVIIQVPAINGEPTVEHRMPTVQLIRLSSSDAIEGRAFILAQVFSQQLRPVIRDFLIEVLSKEPILVYDQERTQNAMILAERNAPRGQRLFEGGKPFVFPHTVAGSDEIGTLDTGITHAELALLHAEHKAFQEFIESDDPSALHARKQRFLEHLGVAAILLVLSISLFTYVGLYQPRIFKVRTRSVAFASLLLIALFAIRVIVARLPHAEFALTPVLLVAAILTIAYPPRFAAGVTVIYITVAALMIRANLGEFVTMLTGGYVAAIMLNDIRTRTKVLSVGMLAGLLVMLTSFAFGLIDHQEVGFAFRRAVVGAGSAILSALIIQGTLPFIEKLFRVATSLTLLEYRDANRPLLRRLAHEAPGTFNHSLVIGNIAESACNAIGADGLLAHVGALYHDIGKIPKAEYFAENQEASINRHDKLAPSMSLLIILGHVKDGLELAKEYAIPRVLYPFIAEHHGTTVVKYFHHRASEKQPKIASGKHDRQVDEAEFRYPGPKPTSKETAVLMLCDGVEGAVRALPEPTPGRIEGIVSQVLQARLKDGQFNNCDITLRELHLVEESLVKSLCRFYHGRVAYPKDEAPKEARGEQKQDQSKLVG